MARICILALIGLPGAGKTSFSRWLLAHAQEPQLNLNVVHLCYDDFLTNAANPHVKFEFRLERAEIKKALKSLIASIRDSQTIPHELQNKLQFTAVNTSADYVIVCDDNHYYHSMRYKLYQYCRAEALSFGQIYFESDMVTSLSRNEERTTAEHVPEHIIKRMAAQIEQPNAAVHRWESTTLQLNAMEKPIPVSEAQVQIVARFIHDLLNCPLKPLVPVTPAEAQASSALHQIDILLRRRVTEQLEKEATQGEVDIDMRARAHELNTKRRETLRQLRQECSPEALVQFANNLT